MIPNVHQFSFHPTNSFSKVEVVVTTLRNLNQRLAGDHALRKMAVSKVLKEEVSNRERMY